MFVYAPSSPVRCKFTAELFPAFVTIARRHPDNSRKSPPNAEYYAMQSTSPSTTEQTAETPLLTPDEFKAIVARLRRNPLRNIDVGLYADVILPCGFLVSIIWSLYSEGIPFTWRSISVLVVWVLLKRWLAYIDWQEKQVVQHLIEFVENTSNPAILGAIIDLCVYALSTGERHHALYEAGIKAMPRLMPLMQRSDADTLNTEQRNILHNKMFSNRNQFDFNPFPHWQHSLLALRMFEQIGDKRDLPAIERISKEEYRTDEIRIAAERCAEVIRERVAREEGKDFLLRPERKPEAVDTLLRPSEERTDTLPEQLLRATNPDDAPPDC